MKNKWIPIATLVLLLGGCMKEEILLENMSTPNLTPSLALPLANVTLNLGDIEREVDANNFVYNDNINQFEIVYKDRLFDLTANDMITIPNQSYVSNFTLTGANQAALLALPVGNTINFPFQRTETFNVGNGAQLDSIIIKTGQLQLDFDSDFRHNSIINLTIPSLTLNGNPLQQVINLTYSGSVPVLSNTTIDISGYTLDLTDNNTTFNTFVFSAPVVITNSGNGLTGNERIQTTLGLQINSFDAIWGYLGQQTNILSQDTSRITLFDDLAGGQIHFEDPQLNLIIGNTAGVDVQAQFSAVFAPDNSTTVNLGGVGLNSLPLIARATNPGDTTITTHTINNSNTSPTLSDLLDEGPGKIVYSSTASTNPSGVTNNFVLGDALVWCDAEVILPLYGWARNFTLSDTSDFDAISQLHIDTTGNFSIDDVEQVLIRIIVTNGLPIDAGVQLYFADTNNVVIDSLFKTSIGVENVFEHGIVDFSLPLSDPNYGKVMQETTKTTDIILTQEMLRKLSDNNAQKLIVKSVALTNNANLGQNVKIFPEYNIDVKVSAKVDFNIDLEN